MFNETFKAISDPIRREILFYLKDKPLNAGEIAEKFNISAPSISYHLNILKRADLIRETKYKNYIYYSLNISVFEEIILWLNNFLKENKNYEDLER